MNKPIVALCGSIGAGKDTVANRLRNQHGFWPVSFAEPLKQIVKAVYALEDRHIFGTQEDKAEELDHVRSPEGWCRTPRQILEWLGTEGFRTIDPDTWVKLGLRRVMELQQEGYPVVVTDTRFENEFSTLRELGAEVWRIHKRGGRQERTRHSSDEEWRKALAVNPAEVAISVDAGDIEELYAQTDSYAQRLLLAGG